MAPLFEVENLMLRRGGFEIRVDRLEIPAGIATVILGPTGAGKSTLLAILGRVESAWLSTPIDEPPRGTVRFHAGGGPPVDLLGLSERELSRRIRGRGIGVVLQTNGLFTGRGVVENVAWPLRRLGISRSEAESRARDALSRVGGIEEDRAVARLSGGESKRLAVARAIALEPTALLLDEPFTGLDPASRDRLVALVADLPPQITPVVVTHLAEAVKALGDHFAMMEAGRVSWFGPRAEAGGRLDRFLAIEEKA